MRLFLLSLMLISITNSFSQAVTCAGGSASLATFNWATVTYNSGSATQTINQTAGGVPIGFKFSYSGNTSTFGLYTTYCGGLQSPVKCADFCATTGGVSGDGSHLVLFADAPTTATFANSVIYTSIKTTRPLKDLRFSISDIDNSYNAGSNNNRRDDVRIKGFLKGVAVRPVGEQVATVAASAYALNNTFSATEIQALGKPLTGSSSSADNENFGTLNIYFNSAVDSVVITYSEANATVGDNPAVRGIAIGNLKYCPSVISLAGVVYNDGNGDNAITSGEANINGTNTGAGVTTGSVLYANLINTDGKVISSSPVQTNGSYSFAAAPQNVDGCIIQLSTTAGVASNNKPATTLPTNWVNTGENKNGNGGPADALVNSEMNVNTLEASLTNFNFGLERLPVPTNVSVSYPMNNPGIKYAVQTLSGSDGEDGAMGIGKKVVIKSLPANAIVTYNDVPVIANQQIAAYDAALLKIDPNDNVITSVFNYAFIDAAGKEGSFASATTNWLSTLPLQLVSFNAGNSSTGVDLVWATSNEVSTRDFTLQRSSDGVHFTDIATINAKGGSSQNYAYVDRVSTAGNYYYQLKINDRDGRYTMSKVTLVKKNNAAMVTWIMAAPNPFVSYLQIRLDAALEGKVTIVVTDMAGRKLSEHSFTAIAGQNNFRINGLDKLPAGVYVLNIYIGEEVLRMQVKK